MVFFVLNKSFFYKKERLISNVQRQVTIKKRLPTPAPAHLKEIDY